MPALSGPISAWWSLPTQTLLNQLHTTQRGFTGVESRHRLTIYGPNDLARQKRKSVFWRLLSKFANPLIILLLIAGLLSATLGQVSDFIIILAITFISVAIDTYQEHSAQNAADKLRKSVSITATVLRDGTKHELPFAQLVPGDIVYLSSGDMVPADGKLLSSEDLMMDQSTLTGESYPQHKHADDDVTASASVSERVSSVFLGTHAVSGEGVMVVAATGTQTELGKISKSLAAARPQTEFERGLAQYGFLLLRVMLVVAVLVFMVHLTLAHEVLSSLLFVLALSVGFAPELLPVIVTINLSKGAIRMAKKGVIVKHLPAIENFGSMDILCMDKTGTLTENDIELSSWENCDGKQSPNVLSYAYLTSHFERGLENPLEKAILNKGKPVFVRGWKRLYELPFDFYRKRMSVILAKGAQTVLITKGAPEQVLLHAQHIDVDGKRKPMTHELRQELHKRYMKLSSNGYRVLGLAYRDVEREKKYTTTDEVDLVFLGYLSFSDPPKKTAKTALALLKDRGITIKILTGDNELVTAKVAEELGLEVSGIVTGKEIGRLSDIALTRAVDRATIFSRLNPETKRRVIDALRRAGHVVGYIGDGVNDAPSLHASDVGISVNNAVDVAKESADLILLHKDLHVLIDGVLEGRKTFSNVMKYIMMGTSSNFGNMFSVAIASLFLPFLPMLPVQILFNDLLYDTSQLLLANDSVDHEAILKPKKWDIHFVRKFMLVFGPISSVFDCLTFVILLLLYRATPSLFQTGWFLESLVTQTLIIFSIRTTFVPFFKSHPNRWFAFSLYGVVAFALLCPLLPVLGTWFSFTVPPISFYGVLAIIVGMYFVIVEYAKRWFYARFSNA